MRFVSWAAYYEGSSDALYFDVLFPRVVREMIGHEGVDLVDMPDLPVARLGSHDRSVEAVAAEICSLREAIDIVFIHADTGGRGLERNVSDRSDAYCHAAYQQCGWPVSQCIVVIPRHETEAWLIADGEAVTQSLGFTGSPNEIGLPNSAAAAERAANPKALLGSAIQEVSGRRRQQSPSNLFPAIAQRQRFEALRQSESFRGFEARLRVCLQSIGCIAGRR